MDVLNEMKRLSFEQLLFCQDQASGLQAVIAIHNTKPGPSLGGCRMWAYVSEEEAVLDALRLARGMTYKAAVYGLGYGGGKCVIIGNPAADKSEALFRALGRSIDGLQGRYITGIDLGTTVQDMDFIRLETKYVTDTTGSIMASGDFTADMTAYGVFLGIMASVKYKLGLNNVTAVKVCVQGLGKVGRFLCKYLYEAGADLIVTDIIPSRMEQAVKMFNARAVSPDAIHTEACDVFAPCAFGGILHDRTIPQLTCQIVAGAANNQLAEERHADLLRDSGILYAPDYVINAGGLIITAGEMDGLAAADLKRSVERVSSTLLDVYRAADSAAVSTLSAANRIAEQSL